MSLRKKTEKLIFWLKLNFDINEFKLQVIDHFILRKKPEDETNFPWLLAEDIARDKNHTYGQRGKKKKEKKNGGTERRARSSSGPPKPVTCSSNTTKKRASNQKKRKKDTI